MFDVNDNFGMVETSNFQLVLKSVRGKLKNDRGEPKLLI